MSYLDSLVIIQLAIPADLLGSPQQVEDFPHRCHVPLEHRLRQQLLHKLPLDCTHLHAKGAHNCRVQNIHIEEM